MKDGSIMKALNEDLSIIEIASYPMVDKMYLIYSNNLEIGKLEIRYKAKESILVSMNFYNNNGFSDNILNELYYLLCKEFSNYRYIEFINFDHFYMSSNNYLFILDNIYYCLNKKYSLIK